MIFPFRASILVALLLAIYPIPIVSSSSTGASETNLPVSTTTDAKNVDCAATTTRGGATDEAVCQTTLFDPQVVFDQILADDYESMDPVVLPQSLAALKSRGSTLCWHKHSTFHDHLLGVHNILRLWGQGPLIGRVGLFHSAYSNSFVNLALFQISERDYMKTLVGSKAEEMVYLFCSIDRQKVVVETLLKLGYIPKDGLSVPHLRNENEQVYLSPETLRLLVVFSMADVADQYFGWQDQLFGGGGNKGSMLIPGQDDPTRHVSTAIWPGISRPGLWMSYLSQLGQVARTFDPEWRQDTSSKDNDDQSDGPLLDIPPVFDNCTKVLSVEDEAASIDLYWEVVTSSSEVSALDATELEQKSQVEMNKLQQSMDLNPWAFEPHVLMAQKLLHAGEFEQAAAAARRALALQSQWGTPWDKRLSLGAWVAWTRVLLQRSEAQEAWPTNSFGVNMLGLVTK